MRIRRGDAEDFLRWFFEAAPTGEHMCIVISAAWWIVDGVDLPPEAIYDRSLTDDLLIRWFFNAAAWMHRSGLVSTRELFQDWRH